MEEHDQSLVEQLVGQNPRFRMLYEEHRVLERELQQLSQKPYLSADDEVEKKKIQKLKLAGKDEMERILKAFRQ